MSKIISEIKAFEIVNEFLTELREKDENGILALYVIGSLGGGYYRPGQSDIDTVILVKNSAEITQNEIDGIAEKYHIKYDIPKGFGSVMIYESELSPPYLKSETEEFEFTVEIARLKIQGKPIFGSINLEDIKMPSKEDFIKDAVIMENWFNKEFGYPMFDKLQITGCVNCILGMLRSYLIIEKNIFDFNKFTTVDTYLANDPPVINEEVFSFIQRKLHDEVVGDERDLEALRKCAVEFREFFNRRLLGYENPYKDIHIN